MTNKRAKIGIEEEILITDYALRFRDMHRTPLAEKILSEVDWPGKPPEVEVLERKISKARAHETLPIDKPWSVASMSIYPIPAEALPSVLRAWVYTREKLNITLTIRQAQWVARLYAAINDIPNLVLYAFSYARFELIGELLGKGYESDTTGADLGLFESMTGEHLSLERRARILGIDIELDQRLGIKLDDSKPQLQKELSAEEATFFTRDSIERSMKIAKVFHLAMQEVKSEEEWAEREVKIEKKLREIDPKLFEEFMERKRKRLHPEQSQEKKEARNERKHKAKKQK